MSNEKIDPPEFSDELLGELRWTFSVSGLDYEIYAQSQVLAMKVLTRSVYLRFFLLAFLVIGGLAAAIAVAVIVWDLWAVLYFSSDPLGFHQVAKGIGVAVVFYVYAVAIMLMINALNVAYRRMILRQLYIASNSKHQAQEVCIGERALLIRAEYIRQLIPWGMVSRIVSNRYGPFLVTKRVGVVCLPASVVDEAMRAPLIDFIQEKLQALQAQ